MTSRRDVLKLALGALAAGLPLTALGAQGARGAVDVEVWKSPTCGCCSLWVEHMRANGFRVRALDLDDVAPVKRKLGVPVRLESCHTGIVAGYTIEGHIPADVIREMLKTKPAIVGLAVPGMPMGSPGMEGPRKDKYDVIAFDKTGKTTVFASR
jgi:hypothetical protein